jgi:hypothetical protein
MPNYKTHTKKTSTSSDTGSDSNYESDGDTNYSPVRTLGEGGYACARLFKSVCNKEIAVLKPVSTHADIEEA